MSAGTLVTPYVAEERAAQDPEYIIGLDLGKKRDWTALALVSKGIEGRPAPERADRLRLTTVYTVGSLDRTQGVNYETISDQVATLKRMPAYKQAPLVIDETGVGTAVGDMLVSRRVSPVRVTITGADTVTRDGNNYRVPKRDLAHTVEALLQTRRLIIAKQLELATVLTAELQNFNVKIDLVSGHDSYGAGEDWRVGNHDDLVLAVALAVWFGEYGKVNRARGF